MAANYPEEPSASTQARAREFMQGLALLYPCSYCAQDFQKEMSASPPDVGSRLAFSLWMCRQHNIVNKKLGKEEFDCQIGKLDERWKVGREGCLGYVAPAASSPPLL